jgi:hypothetical protein
VRYAARRPDGAVAVLALWLIASPATLAEVARQARLLNLALGAWLAIAPWLLAGGSITARAGSALAGLAIVLLSLPVGRQREHYGTFDRAIGFPTA